MDSSMKEAMSYCGFLDKKSPSLFGGWQKRYFKILEGKVLAYADKENSKDYKGTINLEEISDVKSVDKKRLEFINILVSVSNSEEELGTSRQRLNK
jgi:hypothetical protein